jgi:hypothetical protein
MNKSMIMYNYICKLKTKQTLVSDYHRNWA